MIPCGQPRFCAFLMLASISMLILSLQQAEAVPLSRYGRANLSRYGKRSMGERPGPQYVIDDATFKGACKYTGVGELYWCQFINDQSSGDVD